MNKIFTSSVDQDKLALTMKGFIPLVILLVGIFGVAATEVELSEIIDSLIGSLAAVGAAISAVIVFWGLLRKFLVKVGLMSPKI